MTAYEAYKNPSAVKNVCGDSLFSAKDVIKNYLWDYQKAETISFCYCHDIVIHVTK